MKMFSAAVMSIFVIVILSGCGGGEAPVPRADEGAASPHGDIPPVGKPVVELPEIVKGKWKGVVLVVDDKQGGGSGEHKVSLGAKFKVPGSDLMVEVREFFPAFVMQGSSITSMSNDPNNPAALVSVTEGGSEIFSGWLFARYPTTHAFSHPRYSIVLKEGVPR